MSPLSIIVSLMHTPRYLTELLNLISLLPIRQLGMQDKANRLE